MFATGGLSHALGLTPAPSNGTGAQDHARPLQKGATSASGATCRRPSRLPAGRRARARRAVRLTLRPAPWPVQSSARGRASWTRQGERGRGRGAEPAGEGRRRSHDAVSLFTRGAAGSFGLDRAARLRFGFTSGEGGCFGAGGEPKTSAGGSSDFAAPLPGSVR